MLCVRCVPLQKLFEEKRQKAVASEQQRWQQMEEERRREEARMQQVREAGIRGKQNKSSEHFNIISLSYHPTTEGKQLQYKVGGAAMMGLTRGACDALSSNTAQTAEALLAVAGPWVHAAVVSRAAAQKHVYCR